MNRDVDRRQFLHSAVAGALVGVTARTATAPRAARRPTAHSSPMSPVTALRALIDGNRRFAANRLTSIEHDLAVLKAHTAEKQAPFAAVLACADSRVPVELVFDQTIGQLFVARVAGNIVTPEIIASLEYGVAVLGVSALYLPLRTAVERSGGDVTKAIETNARVQADLLRTSSTVIRDAVRAGRLEVVAGVYDLATGNVALSS